MIAINIGANLLLLSAAGRQSHRDDAGVAKGQSGQRGKGPYSHTVSAVVLMISRLAVTALGSRVECRRGNADGGGKPLLPRADSGGVRCGSDLA